MSDRKYVDPAPGLQDAEVERLAAVFDQDFYYLPDLARDIGITVDKLRDLIAFDHELGRPEAGSHFPNAYKEGAGGLTSRIRVPISDVKAYKARRVSGVKLS